MKKVTITFEYDETLDGELSGELENEIYEFLIQYGNEITITEEEI